MLILNAPTSDEGHEQPGHPERPDRLKAVIAGVGDLHLGDDLVVLEPYRATRAELVRVHDGIYLDHLGAFSFEGGGDIDGDTYATFDSWSIAQYTAGAGLAVIRALRDAGNGVGFIAARPPGHHATRNRAMGFCLLNNVAIAAAELTSLGERVLIVDWDVHHGNGTQSIFWHDPNVLYVSTHQSSLFPGSGTAREIGGSTALDRTVNIPVPPGATGDVVRRGLDEIAGPVIDDFKPTWVLVSAGFDAHRADPLAELQLSSGDYAELARTASSYAPQNGRLALFLEGGYDLTALRNSVSATLGTILDIAVEPEAATSGGPGALEIERSLSERRVALQMAEVNGG
jgi:acetoin utilization deacetylase AcuC-like enzyme